MGGHKGERSCRARPQRAWSRPIRFGPRLIRKEVGIRSSAATPYLEGGVRWGAGMTTRRAEPLCPARQAHSGGPKSTLFRLHAHAHCSDLTSPRCPRNPSTQLVSLPNSESLESPACRQARRSDPFPTLEGVRRGNAPGLRRDTPRLGPFAACPEAQSGRLLTSWVWRAAAPRRGLGEAAGFGPGWDIFGEAAEGAASGKAPRNCLGGPSQSSDGRSRTVQ